MKITINVVMLIVFIFSNMFFVPQKADAADISETVRIGLYFGSNSRANIKVSCAKGLQLGYYKDKVFSALWRHDGGAGVIVRKDTYFVKSNGGANGIEEYSPSSGAIQAGTKWGPYHLQYYSNVTIEDAAVKIAELKNMGIKAYISVIGLTYNVWGGNYLDYDEANKAKTESPVLCSVTDVSDRRVNVMDAGTFDTVMIFGHMELGLGVRPTDLDNEMFTINTSAVTTYRGGLDFKRLDGGSLTVSNVVNLESYLYRVISREMNYKWPAEALKAQAVCARNYAVRNLNKHKASGYDLCNDVHCQAYLGLEAEYQSCIDATEATRGKLLMYNGQIAETYYSSSMGAYTEDVKNVWGTSYPYLVSVENKYEDTANISNGKWSGTLTKAEATDIMKSKGYDVGNVISIDVVEYTPSGAVLALLVTGTNGSKKFERESTRNIFSNITLSQRYTVSGGAGAGTINSGDIVSVMTDIGVITRPANGMTVVDGEGKKRTISQGSVYVIGDGMKKSYSADGAQASSSGDENTFYFSGEGWGHGVGMSQYGARGMAEAGFTYDKILTHYFTGTYLE